MKKLKFTGPEREWISKSLRFRIANDETRGIFCNKNYLAAQSALEKVLAESENFYKPWEVTLIVSCVNEQLYDYFPQVDLPDANAYLHISEPMLTACNFIDMGKDILVKCRMHKAKTQFGYNFETRYRDRFAAIDRLRKAEDIYLSGSVDHGFYKIGILCGGTSLAVIELEQHLEGRDIQFQRLPTDPVSYRKGRFSVLTQRAEALRLLSHSRVSERSAAQIAFVREVLN
jgi:hypothetical protein